MADNKKRILIVDDNPDEIHVLIENLKQNYAVLAATSGERALKVAAHQPQPDIILMDVCMPGMDGYETSRRLKEDTLTQKIDIVFVSSNGSVEEKIVGYDIGGSDYLIKPVQPEELKQKIRLLIRNQETYADAVHTHQQLDEAQNQLLQSDKMAAIGQLAAGVAHEINNPVGYINSNIKTLQGYISDLFGVLDAYKKLETIIPDGSDELRWVNAIKEKVDLHYVKDDIRDLLNESQEGVDRVRRIVQDLKDFSRVDEAEWQLADLHKGIDSTLNIVQNELKYKADVIKLYGELPETECIPSQINQVIMNILVNAAQAIEQRGMITITTTQNSNNVVTVKISDTGSGIESENLRRVMEPFFTTKPVGKGTGLGLSLSYSIIEKHGGSIAIDSVVGKGTTFTICLPVRQKEQRVEH